MTFSRWLFQKENQQNYIGMKILKHSSYSCHNTNLYYDINKNGVRKFAKPILFCYIIMFLFNQSSWSWKDHLKLYTDLIKHVLYKGTMNYFLNNLLHDHLTNTFSNTEEISKCLYKAWFIFKDKFCMFLHNLTTWIQIWYSVLTYGTSISYHISPKTPTEKVYNLT